MLQLVAGLTVFFVGYVLYEVFKTVSSESSSSSSEGNRPAPAATVKPEKSAPEAAPVAAARPAAKPAETKKAEAEQAAGKIEAQAPEAEPADEEKGLLLRDPQSGETGPAPTNYRFAKKWIKDALVAEGLLDKVYKNADLDEAGSKKVKEALDRLRMMKKYRA